MYNEEKAIIYEGDFLKFQFQGKGILYKELYLYYEGEFLGGKINSKDIIYYNYRNKCY